MKKTLSLILALVICLISCAVTALAEPVNNNNQKADDGLKAEFAALLDNEALGVWIWFVPIDEKEMERRIEEESGLSLSDVEELRKTHSSSAAQMDEWFLPYQAVREKVIKEMYTGRNNRILDELGVPASQREYVSSSMECAIVYLTKSQFEAALAHEEVAGIKKNGGIYPIEPEPVTDPQTATEPETVNNNSDKADDSLKAEFAALSDNETLVVWIQFIPTDESYTDLNNRILDELGVPASQREYVSSSMECAIVYLTKSQFEAALAHEEVARIENNGGIYPIEPEPVTEPEPATEPDISKYKDRFEAYLYSRYGDDDGIHTEIICYKELYYHKDPDGNTDWVMVEANAGMEGQDWVGFATVGNRAIVTEMEGVFPFRMLLYDVKNDSFVSLASYVGYKPDYSKYDGLRDAIEKYGQGRLLGDVDRDDELTIVDCTFLQRYATRIGDWPEDDIIDTKGIINPFFEPLTYYSDFNRDGERDVTDATKLQRYVTYID